IFVLCHSLLQLPQLLHSAYFKSCITTIERCFGFQQHMGNMVLVVFVSYFGSRVNRPRFIGLGGLLMSCAAATLALPHFLSKPYQYHFMSAACGSWDTCVLRENSSAPEVCRQGGGGDLSEARTQWLTLAASQVLFGIGSVPIQPFGISYIDDFAEPGNSALYLAILFSISVFGPAFGYLLGSMMLRIYVDVDKIGLVFPRLLLRMLLRPVFLLLILSQCLATFLSKFLEHQYGTTTAYGSLLMGAITLPMAAVGLLLGVVVMKRLRPPVRTLLWLRLVPLSLSILLCVPLFFMGCSTQRVAGVNTGYGDTQDQWTNRSLSLCNSNCSCLNNVFNPVCGEDNTEYISPCHAGCTNVTIDPLNLHRVQLCDRCARCACCAHWWGLYGDRQGPPSPKKSYICMYFIYVSAWLPAPAVFGLAIDYSCVWWKQACGSKLGACGYYDNNILRNRYFGLQVGYKCLGLVLLALAGWRVQHTPGLSIEKEPEGPV
ncbi:unnamed protein product, partial [Coregonus sp. 'balchen']